MDSSFHLKSLETPPPLNPSLYALDETASAFFKSATGIHDDDELKEHILDVQRQAYTVAPYPCIRSFSFTRVTISKVSAYEDALKLGRERKGALFLDIGCGFGNDSRKAALDGFPVKQIIASDLRQELWDLGHSLFRSSPESFPATFVAGDAFDPSFLSPVMNGSEPLSELNLANLGTLNELRGKVSAIWASSFFHLFSEEDQRRLAHAVGSLLSPESGSVMFGYHVALPSKGIITGKVSNRDVNIFCHDPESWREMWVGRPAAQVDSTACADSACADDSVDCSPAEAVFPAGSVKFDTTLVRTKSEGGDGWMWHMMWSITRV